MCGGNIRLAFDFIRAFLGSGHVDTGKILDIYRKTGGYLVPLHEFLRAVIYGDHLYYYPAASEIVNVFDVSTFDGGEHFLSPLLLSQLTRWSQNSATDGFVSVSEIYDYLQGLSFQPPQIDWAIVRLLQKNLLEAPTKERDSESVAAGEMRHYRITTIGAYYVKKLTQQFSYIDAVADDTPILEEPYTSSIGPVSFLEDRLQRARLFCDYLDFQWERFQEANTTFDWIDVRRGVIREIRNITRRITPPAAQSS